MLAVIRRKLAMIARARDFVQAFPSTDASFVTVVTQLKERLARAEALAVQERDGREREQGMVRQRRGFRESLHRLQLTHLVRTARRAERERPSLAGEFRRPIGDGPHHTFITSARAMLAAAQGEKELLLKYGLGETFLDELSKSITDFDSSTEQVHSYRMAHIGARGDLKVVTDECLELVGVLDGLVRNLFRDNAEALAAWESASAVVRFKSRPDEPGVEPTPAPTPEPGTPEIPALPVSPVVPPPAEGNVAA